MGLYQEDLDFVFSVSTALPLTIKQVKALEFSLHIQRMKVGRGGGGIQSEK